MSDPLGIDLGNVLMRAEQIKSARVQNEINRRTLTEEEELRALRKRALDGQIEAMDQMVAINPKAASSFQSYFDGLDDRKKAQVGEDVENAGKMAAFVLQDPNPQQAYGKVLEHLGRTNPKLAAQMPREYNEDWVRMQIAQASSLSDIINGGKGKAPAPPSGYRWKDDGKSLEFIPGGPKDPGAPGSENNTLENASSSNIRQMVAPMFNGIYHPMTGNMEFNDAEKAKQAVSVMAEAERIMLRDRVPPAVAVERAIGQATGNVTAPGAPPAGGSQTPAPSSGGVIRFDQL
jgi:hypothetical protein